MNNNPKNNEKPNDQQPNTMMAERENQLAIAADPNREIEPQIFKLTINCVHKFFDYLSLKDICAVSKTCKRMNAIAGDYMKWNFSAAEMECCHSELKVNGQNFNDFCALIPNIEFIQSVTFPEQYIDVMARKPLKKAHFYSTYYDINDIQRISRLLNNVETVSFFIPRMKYEFYESFMKHCKHIRSLRIRSWEEYVIGTDNSWLLRRYPTLESLELKIDDLQVNELGEFFALNPNVRRLSIDEQTLLTSYSSMLKTKTQLEELIVLVRSHSRDNFNILNSLYHQGFYRRLHVYVRGANQQTINRIASLHGLEKLYMRGYCPALVLNALTNIKELALIFDRDDFDIQKTATNLIHLEKLYFTRATPKTIRTFMQHSANLRAIKVEKILGASLDLSTLNRIRSGLQGAKKVSIYLREEDFLQIKWANRMGTDHSLIDLKRYDSDEWFIPFHFTPVPWPWELNDFK